MLMDGVLLTIKSLYLPLSIEISIVYRNIYFVFQMNLPA